VVRRTSRSARSPAAHGPGGYSRSGQGRFPWSPPAAAARLASPAPSAGPARGVAVAPHPYIDETGPDRTNASHRFEKSHPPQPPFLYTSHPSPLGVREANPTRPRRAVDSVRSGSTRAVKERTRRPHDPERNLSKPVVGSPENSSGPRRKPPPYPRTGAGTGRGHPPAPRPSLDGRCLPCRAAAGRPHQGRSAPSRRQRFPLRAPRGRGHQRRVRDDRGQVRSRPRRTRHKSACATARPAPPAYRAPTPFSWRRVPRSGMTVRSGK
jgi:hypothetical protein